MANRGVIRCEEAYAQGKMLDNSAWNYLPRGITPSDIDLVFDNAGRMLICELSRHHARWGALRKHAPGQVSLYEILVRRGCTAALLKHSVPSTQTICSRNDIDSFAIMKRNGDGLFISEKPRDGSEWPAFVDDWFGVTLGL